MTPLCQKNFPLITPRKPKILIVMTNRHYFFPRRKTMLESIAKNIATAIFLVCALLVGSLFPEKEDPKPTKPAAAVVETDSETTEFK